MLEQDPEEPKIKLFERGGRFYQDFTPGFTQRVKRYQNSKSMESTPGTIVLIATHKHRQHSQRDDDFCLENDILFIAKEVDCPPHGDWERTVGEGFTHPGCVRLE